MVTTIQIKEDVKISLDRMKMYWKDSLKIQESWMRKQKKIFKRQ